MKISSLLYALVLVCLDLFLIYTYEFYSPSFLIAFIGVISVVSLGMLIPINSFMAKFMYTMTISAYASYINGFSLESIILFSSLALHSSSLWFESEKFGSVIRRSEHFKVTHRIRHQWFSSLGFFAGLAVCYLLIRDFYNFPELYGVTMLLVEAVMSLIYMEVNRTHNQSMLWLDISGALTKSGYYWRMVAFMSAVLFGIFWYFATPASDYLLELRSKLEQEDDNMGEEDDGPLVKAPGTRSGFSPGDVVLTSKVDIELSEKPEFYVKMEDRAQARRMRKRPLYVTAQELIYYSKNVWRPESVEFVWFRDEDDGDKDGHINFGREHKYSIKHSIYLLRPGATSVFYLTGMHRIDLPEVFQSSMGVMGMRQGGKDQMRKYTVHSNYYNFNFIRKGSLRVGTAEPKYTQLPISPVVEKIKELTGRIVKPGDSGVQKILKIKKFLESNCSYSLKVQNPGNRAPLDNFIFHERRGHCVLFASAFTIMLRSAGIPARMVNGFAGGDYDNKRDIYIMKSSNAHAWTEVYCQNYGWVVCDPTPEAFNAQLGSVEAENFDEANFENMSGAELASSDSGSASDSFFSKGKNVLLTMAMLFAILSFAWQYIKKIPGISFVRDVEKKIVYKRPAYIIAFEEFCKAKGVIPSKAKTVRELVAELMAKGDRDDEILNMVNYYYDVTFANAARSESREKMWHSHIAQRIRKG